MIQISERRRSLYNNYRQGLRSLEVAGQIRLPRIPEDCQSNYHLFYLLLLSPAVRDALLQRLKAEGVTALFHYVPLHSSPCGLQFAGSEELPVTDDASARLIRLPMFYDLSEQDQRKIVDALLRLVPELCQDLAVIGQATVEMSQR